MSLNDPLSNALSSILNAEKTGKEFCLIKPASKIIKRVLEIMQDNKYIGGYEILDDGKSGLIKLNLLGRLNKCGVIKPRFSVKIENYEKYEKRFLLAKDFGFMVVSTNSGLMVHSDAKKKKIGGRLIAYFY